MNRKSLHDYLFADLAHPGMATWAPWLRYLVVTAMVAVALGVRLFLLPALPEYAFLPFCVAVVLAGFIPGAGPAVYASILSLPVASFFYSDTFGAVGSGKLLSCGMFLLFCLVVCALRKHTVNDRAYARASKRLLQSIFESNPDALLIIDAERVVVMANRQAALLFGYEHGKLNGRRFENLVPERVRAIHPLLNMSLRLKHGARSQPHSQESLILRKDGQEIEVEMNIKAVRTDHGPVIACTLRDIRARNKAEADLRISATAFESNDGIIVTDAHGLVQRVNQAFTRISGYGLVELGGRNTDILRSSRHDEEFYRTIIESLTGNDGWQGEIWARRRSGEEYPVWLNISAVHDKEGKVTHYVASHSDITERKQAEAEIKDLAFFDQLTGLPNRTLFADRLKQAIRIADRNGKYGALLFIDLDNFKELNDTMGHDIGDKLLRQVAKRLLGLNRETDTVARLGGDEFIVILGELSDTQSEASEQIASIAEKTLNILRAPYHLGDVTYTSTASIGATLFREKSGSFEELMKQADLAMYKSKAVGRNTIRVFDPSMEAAIMERARLESDLRYGLAHENFAVYYQAQVGRTGQLTGAEALVRWHHPQRGLVSPASFIRVAEESGLILPLGLWVLKTACAQLAAWSRIPQMQHLTLAVNVSVSQFRQPDFVKLVLDAIESSGADPKRLKLELTESLLVDDVPTVIAKMNVLKSRGVGFSLDDFGTGYSSLAYLKRMPLDQLKIDQSFVQDVLVDPSDAAIARTIVALARSLDLSVIAEGVETEAQRRFLAENGCYDYQGYLFSVPLPIEEFEEFAQSNRTVQQPVQA